MQVAELYPCSICGRAWPKSLLFRGLCPRGHWGECDGKDRAAASGRTPVGAPSLPRDTDAWPVGHYKRDAIEEEEWTR